MECVQNEMEGGCLNCLNWTNYLWWELSVCYCRGGAETVSLDSIKIGEGQEEFSEPLPFWTFGGVNVKKGDGRHFFLLFSMKR